LDSGFGVTVIACAWEVDAHGMRSCDSTDTEVSELQRLALRKRGRRLVGLELIEGVSKLKRALARRSIRTFSCTFTGEFPTWISSQDIKFLRAVACQRFDTASVTQ
jgi:hypothetical protein